MKYVSRSITGMICLAGLIAARGLLAQPVPAPAPPPSAVSLPVQVPPAPVVAPQPSLDDLLKWDADRKELTVPHGTASAPFIFSLTNVSKEVVTIHATSTSCGCTVASLPEQPWRLAPGTNGQISAAMNLAGKSGTTVKTITVATDKGNKVLYVQATILPALAMAQMTDADREKNQKLAIADRQAVFKGECASCHAEPAKAKFGQPLFTAVCGVCHEAEHRATMVPDLHKIAQPTNAEYWRNWITHGKAGTLMPAFSLADGGILNEEQINSLVNYLVVAIPSKPAIPAPKPQASAK